MRSRRERGVDGGKGEEEGLGGGGGRSAAAATYLRVLSSSARREEVVVRAAAAAVEDEKSGEAAGRETTLHRDQIDPSGRLASGAAPRPCTPSPTTYYSRRVASPSLLSSSLSSSPLPPLRRRAATLRWHARFRHTCEAEYKGDKADGYQPHPVAPHCVFLRKERR